MRLINVIHGVQWINAELNSPSNDMQLHLENVHPQIFLSNKLEITTNSREHRIYLKQLHALFWRHLFILSRDQ